MIPGENLNGIYYSESTNLSSFNTYTLLEGYDISINKLLKFGDKYYFISKTEEFGYETETPENTASYIRSNLKNISGIEIFNDKKIINKKNEFICLEKDVEYKKDFNR